MATALTTSPPTGSGAPLQRVSTSQGEVELPIRYWDASTLAAMFTVPADVASEMVAPLGVTPLRGPRDRAQAALVFYEYRHTSVGVYNEVGLTIVCAPHGTPVWRATTDPLRPVRQRQAGWAVVDLPVTTHRANAAGREVWGYPKFVTDIPIHVTPTAFHGQVLDPDGGGAIVTLEGALGVGIPVPALDLVTYTHHQGATWRTVVDVRGHFRWHRGAGMLAHVGTSHHPMAQRLRTLGLDGAKPRGVLLTHDWRSLLHPGAPHDPTR